MQGYMLWYPVRIPVGTVSSSSDRSAAKNALHAAIGGAFKRANSMQLSGVKKPASGVYLVVAQSGSSLLPPIVLLMQYAVRVEVIGTRDEAEFRLSVMLSWLWAAFLPALSVIGIVTRSFGPIVFALVMLVILAAGLLPTVSRLRQILAWM